MTSVLHTRILKNTVGPLDDFLVVHLRYYSLYRAFLHSGLLPRGDKVEHHVMCMGRSPLHFRQSSDQCGPQTGQNDKTTQQPKRPKQNQKKQQHNHTTTTPARLSVPLIDPALACLHLSLEHPARRFGQRRQPRTTSQTTRRLAVAIV